MLLVLHGLGWLGGIFVGGLVKAATFIGFVVIGLVVLKLATS